MERSLNNIAVLKLNESFVLNDLVQPAGLPLPGYKIPENLEIVGYGTFNFSDDYRGEPSTPRGANVSAIAADECRKIFNHNQAGTGDKFVTRTSICARSNNQTGCFADYGGPLYATLAPKKHVVLGLQTLRGCTDSDYLLYPAIYVDVVQFVDFISNVTGLCVVEEGNSKVGYLKECGSGGVGFNMSAPLSESLCVQYENYQQSGIIPDPVKEKPPTSTIKCGRFGHRQCDGTSCYPFDFKKCPW